MKVFKLENMTKGWFVGEFSPSAFSTGSCEVAVKRYEKGDYESLHHHRIATEITVIVSGRVLMSGRVIEAGEIVVLEPFDATDFTALENTVTTVVKVPGALNDKYHGRVND